MGVGVGAVSSAFWATRDAVTGQPRGVTVDLANALARKLGRPLELIVYPNSGELTAAGPRGEWDVAFMPVDDERAKVVDFGPAYYLLREHYWYPRAPASAPSQTWIARRARGRSREYHDVAQRGVP